MRGFFYGQLAECTSLTAHNAPTGIPAHQMMLTEIARTHQRPGEPRRRWFTSETLDLMVWLDEAGELLAFQFSYGKPQDEKALSWSRQQGLSAQQVEDGSNLLPGHKASPLLVAAPLAGTQAAAAAFAAASQNLPAAYAGYILQLLQTATEKPHDQ
ncbi:MAG TPA: hypothetical protein VF050_10735 [Moraxellaceae bacterium]